MLYTNVHDVVELFGCQFMWARKDHQQDSFFTQISEAPWGIADGSVHGAGRVTAIFYRLKPEFIELEIFAVSTSCLTSRC
jgi:hypothetical protein